MRLRHIEIFHAVYTCGSITATAKVLNVSQPSVSKVLAHAESQLGYRLFERHKGKIIPTREADHLIDHVMGAYQHIEELRRISKNLSADDSGTVRFASTPTFGVDFIPNLVASYLASHPGTRFDIETLHHQQIARAIKEHRIDLGLAFAPHQHSELQSETLASARFMVIASKNMPLDVSRPVSLEEIAHLPMIQLSERGPLGKLLKQSFDAFDITPHTVATVETYQMAKALAARGVGVCLVDEITARSSEHLQTLCLELDWQVEFEVVAMFSQTTPLPLVTQRFYDALKSEISRFLSQQRHDRT